MGTYVSTFNLLSILKKGDPTVRQKKRHSRPSPALLTCDLTSGDVQDDSNVFVETQIENCKSYT